VPFLQQLCGFDSRSLPLLQRILLVCDGTLTDTIEAAFQEPIILHKVEVTVARATEHVPELAIEPGAEVMRRRIELRGGNSGRVYVQAESLLALDHLPEGFRRDLVESNVPLGRLWSDYRLETWKELLTVRREDEMLTRTYRVISGGRPIMRITESFPVAY
jgi:chorismate-pyruvate lyase